MRISVRDKSGRYREGGLQAGCLTILVACLFIGGLFFMFAWPGLRYWYTDYQLRGADGVTQATVINTVGVNLFDAGLGSKVTRLVTYHYRVVGPDGRIQDYTQRDIASEHDLFTRLTAGATVTIRYRTDNPAIARRVDALGPPFGLILLWAVLILPLCSMVLIAGLNTVRFQMRRRLRTPAQRFHDQQERERLTAQGLLFVNDTRAATRLRQMRKQHPQIAAYVVINADAVFVSPDYLRDPDDQKFLRHLLSGASVLDLPATFELSALLDLLPLNVEEQARQRKTSEELLRSLPTFGLDRTRKDPLEPKE